jgi:hypothetical protein
MMLGQGVQAIHEIPLKRVLSFLRPPPETSLLTPEFFFESTTLTPPYNVRSFALYPVLSS